MRTHLLLCYWTLFEKIIKDFAGRTTKTQLSSLHLPEHPSVIVDISHSVRKLELIWPDGCHSWTQRGEEKICGDYT